MPINKYPLPVGQWPLSYRQLNSQKVAFSLQGQFLFAFGTGREAPEKETKKGLEG
jgi:hypothetical protein